MSGQTNSARKCYGCTEKLVLANQTRFFRGGRAVQRQAAPLQAAAPVGHGRSAPAGCPPGTARPPGCPPRRDRPRLLSLLSPLSPPPPPGRGPAVTRCVARQVSGAAGAGAARSRAGGRHEALSAAALPLPGEDGQLQRLPGRRVRGRCRLRRLAGCLQGACWERWDEGGG